MKNIVKKFGGLILFYSVIVFGVLLLNQRFAELNELNNNDEYHDYVAMNQ